MATTPSARRKARKYIVQALYQWQLTQNPLHEIETQFHADHDLSNIDTVYFSKILHGVPSQASKLDETLAQWIDRDVKELDPISLAILRMGVYEMQNCIDVPYRVVINEGVNLAKTFGATDSFKYVNGVLDKAAKSLRSAEVNAR